MVKTSAKLPEFLGFYKPVERIGEGSMGEVILCHDPALGRRVVVKRMSLALGKQDEMVARFTREVQVLASLEHPNIVSIHGFWQEKGNLHLAMSWVDGWTLRAIADSAGALPPWVVAMIADDLLSALEHAHARGIVHRDIKPSNIMLDREGRTRLLDFGIARVDGSQDMTLPGTLIGTIAYMSPEQARGDQATPASDLFSLACIVWEMLVGRHPFRQGDAEATRTAILQCKPDKATLPTHVPAPLRAFLRLALSKDPSRRPDATHLRALLSPIRTELADNARAHLAGWFRAVRHQKLPYPAPSRSRSRLPWSLLGSLLAGFALGWLAKGLLS